MKGAGCPKIHDFSKTALCPSVLNSKGCRSGMVCRLQHTPTPQTLPSCLYFLENRCGRSECVFSHAKGNALSFICPDFAHLGHCEKGFECGLRHLRWCPSFTNAGMCLKTKCSMLHMRQAGSMNRASNTVRRSKSFQEQYITGSQTSEFSAQRDFVGLD